MEKAKQGLVTLEEVVSAAYWEGPSSGKPPEKSDIEERRKQACRNGPSQPRIVFVDDDAAVREAVELALGTLSCEVITAGDGLQGWEEIQCRLPDLIITDINMPRLDGFELLKKIRTELSTTFIPVILLTGRNRCEDRVKGFLMGSDDYIEKPFDHREFLARVKRCLERQSFIQH